MLSSNPEAVLGSLKLPDGGFSTSDEETLKCLIKAHFPSFTERKKEWPIQEKKTAQSADLAPELQTGKPDSYPREDKMDNKFL